MLVLEDSDDEKLYFAKGPPRECVTSGKEIKIQQALRANLSNTVLSKPTTLSLLAESSWIRT